MSLRTHRWAAAVASTAVAAALLSAAPPAQAASLGFESASPPTVQPAVSPAPFDCSPVFFQSAAQSNYSDSENFYTYSPLTNTFSQLGPSRTGNGKTQVLGYNTDDSYVYGLFNVQYSADDTRMDLVRINSAGTYTRLNSWKVPNQLNVGDFWKSPQGMRFVVGGDYMNDWRLINVAITNDDTTQPSSDFAITGSGSSPYFRGKDIVIQGDVGYGLHLNTLYILNLNDRRVTTKTVTFNPASDNHADGFGSAYADALGNLYFFENSSSKVWRIAAGQISKASPVATMVGSGPAYVSSGVTLRKPNDGASCPTARSPYSAVISGETATSITDDTAALTASVRPFEVDTTARICIGLSPQTSGGRLNGCQLTADAANADDTHPLDDTTVSTGLTPITVSNLSPRTTYYWQVVTSSTWAITYGAVATFTTTAAPEATTSPVTGVSSTAATLNGVVNPGGQSTNVTFCWGTQQSLTTCDGSPPASQSPVAASSNDTTVSTTLSGLQPGTTYYARVSAANADGDDSGTIVSFTTSAVPLVSLGNATDVTSTDARLTGQVNPKGLATVVTFCWGTQPSLATCDDSAAASQSPLMPIDDSASVSVDLTGLTAATQYYMRISASNARGDSLPSTIGTFTTAANPLTLTTTTGALPGANVGEPYSKTLTAGGGQPPYTWTVASGTLPPGLTLITLDDTSGLISGTPTVAGATSFVVRVTDATSATATRTYSISTGAPPSATTKTVTSVAGTTVTLNGVVNPGNLLTAVDFCYGTAANLSGCSSINATQSPLAASTDDTVVSVTLSALQPGTTYYARVRATNSDDSSTGSIVSFTTTNKPSVTTGSATFLRGAGTTATLSGTVNPNGLSTSVDFCWGTTPTLDSCTPVPAGTLSASRSPSVVSIDDTRLSPNVTYYFTVQARNSLGTTIGSTATFTMPSSSAVGPTITSVSPASGPVAGGTTVTITGTNFATTGSLPTVLFDDSAATVTARTATSITATSPAAAYPGLVDVIVANPDGQAFRKVDAFTYISTVRYDVTYVGNGWTSGAVPTDDTAYQYDDTVTVAAAGTMARAGYSFDGWNTADNGTGTAHAANSQFRIHSDDTLYAQWTPVAIKDLSDDTVNFGQQSITSGASERAVAVINAGAAAMTVTSISLTGDDSTDFDIDGGTCSGGSTVTGNSSCTIDLAFAPSQLGSRSAALQVTTTAGTLTGTLVGVGTTTYSVTYFGNGATSGSPPTDPTAYAPGSTVTVLGQGSLAWTGYEFSGWNTTAGGGGTPRAAGSTYAISGDDSLFAQWTPVGVPDLGPATLSFGSRQVSNGASAPQTATLTNSGAAALTITSVSVTGADASDFTRFGGTCSNGASIAPAASCSVGVTFDPTQSGARAATLRVVTSAGTVTSALTGTGTSPTPTPTPATPPGAPRAVTGQSGDSAVIVTWEAPTSAGSFPITDYQVVTDPGSATCQVTAPARKCIVTGLVNGVAYTFRVRALNGAGWGTYSSASDSVTPQAGPTPSVLIVGGRAQATPRQIWVKGSAATLIGETLLPQFRFPGQVGYRDGVRSVIVDSEGSFTWQRRSGKDITVRFTSGEVRSNSLRIPAPPRRPRT